jgi:RNA polymerase sigma factor (sigma-70 family)
MSRLPFEVLEPLITLHYVQLWQFALERAFNDQEDASAAIAHLWEKGLDSFDPAKGDFVAFAKELIRRKVIDLWRRRVMLNRKTQEAQMLVTEPIFLSETPVYPHDTIEYERKVQTLETALDEFISSGVLNEMQKAAFLGQYSEAKVSDNEIAAKFNVSAAAVKMARCRAKQAFTKRLENLGLRITT